MLEPKIHTILKKKVHGKYFTTIGEPHIDKKSSLAWLKSSTLKKSTKTTICAIREDAISTMPLKKNIHKTIEDDICQACKQTIQHVISGFPVLASTKYIKRHSNIWKYIHICLEKKYEFL